MAFSRRSTPLWQVDLPNRPLPVISKDDSASSLVAQALENIRDSPDGSQNPDSVRILETEVTNIWRKIEAQPTSYVMTGEEFLVFSYFQGRFAGHQHAAAARRRYWDHLELAQGADRADVKNNRDCYLPCESKDQDIGITDKMDASDTRCLNAEIIHSPSKAFAQEIHNSTGNFNIHDDEGSIVRNQKYRPRALDSSPRVVIKPMESMASGKPVLERMSMLGASCGECHRRKQKRPPVLISGPQLSPTSPRKSPKVSPSGDGLDPSATATKILKEEAIPSTPSSHGSACSEDETDWEEDECLSYVVDKTSSHHVPTAQHQVSENIADSAMNTIKLELVGRLMDQSWVILNHDTSGIRQCGSSNSTPDSTPSVTENTSTEKTGAKRQRGRARDEDLDEDNERSPKRKGKGPETQAAADIHLKFACPYRKHNPRKYCIKDWQRCVLTPHTTVARVKCEETFKSEEELDVHIKSDEGCRSRELATPLDGITSKLRKQIQCRKKAHPGQTEESRWKQIYEMIFPGVPVPEPCKPYESDSLDRDEGGAGSPAATDLVAFHQYLRRVLEVEVNNEVEPIEERLRGRLIDIIDQAFSRFQAIRSPDNILASQPAGTIEEYSLFQNEKHPRDVEEKSPHQITSSKPSSCSKPNSTNVSTVETGKFSRVDEAGYPPIELSIGEHFTLLEPTVLENASLEFTTDDFDCLWGLPEESIDTQSP
ncbi:hypothetical protein ACEPPN_010667 [Leptodophora sp. 'Broadleaf-Isolate-01']